MNNQSKTNLYHYSMVERIDKIIEEGQINVEASKGLGGKLAVWATTRDEWEPTCNKGIVHPRTGKTKLTTTEEMYTLNGGVCRFVLEWEHGWMDWDEYKRKAKYPPQWYARLRETAEDVGSDVNTFYTSFRAVPLHRIEDIQQFIPATREWISIVQMDEWHNLRMEMKREFGY